MPFVEKSIRVQAMILAHYNYGESDRFVRMLTPDRGKLSALARGVRKMNSRKAGHLEPFTVVSAQLVQGRGSAWTVQQVETQETQFKVKNKGRESAPTGLFRRQIGRASCRERV